MRVNIVRTTIAEQLAPLFARARAEGLYFHGHYQNMWFSPDELEALQAQGEFRWGAVNWELRCGNKHWMAPRLSAEQRRQRASMGGRACAAKIRERKAQG